MENTQIVNTTPAAYSANVIPAHVEVSAPVLEVAAEVVPVKAKRVRKAPVAKVEVAAAVPAKAKRKAAVKKVAVVEAAPAETRVYTKRKRTFNLMEQNAIIASVKAIGMVPTAAAYNTLYIYIAKIVKSRRVKIALGRRPFPKTKAA